MNAFLPGQKHKSKLSLTVINNLECTSHVCVILECQKHGMFDMTVFFTEDLGIILTLAFPIQTIISLLKYQKQVIFQYDSLREGLTVILKRYKSK